MALTVTSCLTIRVSFPEQLGKSVDDSADDVDAIRVVDKSYNPNQEQQHQQQQQRRQPVRGARDRSSTSSRERQQQHRNNKKHHQREHKSKKHRRHPREFSPYQDDAVAEAEDGGEQG